MKTNTFKMAGLVGMLISLAMVCMSFVYIQKTSEVRDAHNADLFNYHTDNQYVTKTAVSRLSNEIGAMSAVCFGYFLVLSVLSLNKFRKSIFLFPGVIGCTGMLVWTYLLINNPMAITFDEVGPVWIVLALVQMMLTVLALKQLQNKRFN